MGCSEVYRNAFGSEFDVVPACELTRLREHRLEHVVGVGRVMMEHQRTLRSGFPHELCEVGERRMPPADSRRVLLDRELRVVEQEIDALGDRNARVAVERRLVVGDERERASLLLEPVADRAPWVLDGRRSNADTRDLELVLPDLPEGRVTGDLVERHGEQRWRDVAGDVLLERPLGRSRPPHVDVALRVEQGEEEPETLDVVEVHVRQQQVHLVHPLARQLDPERSDTGAGVEHDHGATDGADLDAARVAAVADRRRARRGQ